MNETDVFIFADQYRTHNTDERAGQLDGCWYIFVPH